MQMNTPLRRKTAERRKRTQYPERFKLCRPSEQTSQPVGKQGRSPRQASQPSETIWIRLVEYITGQSRTLKLSPCLAPSRLMSAPAWRYSRLSLLGIAPTPQSSNAGLKGGEGRFGVFGVCSRSKLVLLMRNS